MCVQTSDYNPDVEILERDQNDDFEWSLLQSGISENFKELYPFVFVLPDLPKFAEKGWGLAGKLFMAGADSGWRGITTLYDQTATQPDFTPFGGKSCTPGSSAVMFPDGRIMKFGGSGAPSRMTEVIDFSSPNAPAPVWRRTAPTSVGRHYSTAVVLPDGTVLATGGSMRSNQGDLQESSFAIRTTELFSPGTAGEPGAETWCRLADIPPAGENMSPIYRGYHSQSFLLPDGRVFLGSGGQGGGSLVDHTDYQFFFPPYLFAGPRPAIALPDDPVITTGSITTLTFDRLNEVDIEKVTLIKLSSSTHNWDMEQRFLELDILAIDAETVTVAAPTSTCYATPGPYMLFALSADDGGVPSIGQYLYVDGGCEASEEAADPPAIPVSMGITNAPHGDGLDVACGSTTGQITLSTFGRSVENLCQAFSACPENGTVTLEARLLRSDNQTVPSGGIVLDTAQVAFSDGVPSVSDDLSIRAKAAAWTATIPGLGEGRNVVQICASVASLTFCKEQTVHVKELDIGPDAGGYRATTIERRFVPLSRIPGSRRVPLTNDGVHFIAFPAGFTFPFYGTYYNGIHVMANGGLRLASGATSSTNTAFPTGTIAGPHIAPFWDALDVESGGRVLSLYQGDRMVVSWERVSHALVTNGHTISFQAHLFNDGRIEFHYEDVALHSANYNDGASASIGVQDASQSVGLSVSANDSTLLSGAKALAISPSECVASALRASHDTPCTPALPLQAPARSYVCGDGEVTVPTPPLPTICDVPPDAFVHGTVPTASSHRPVIADAMRLPAGLHTVQWSVHQPIETPTGRAYSPYSDPSEQLLEVKEVHMPYLCCDPGQTVHTLTSSADTAVYGVTATEPVCVEGLRGDDDVESGAAADVLMGNEGDDVLAGGGGSDRLYGGSGDDQLAGEDGSDLLYGDDGLDYVIGGNGNDQLRGGPGDDELDGEDGEDVIFPGSGADQVLGGDDDDDIVILDLCEAASGEVLDGGPGDDRLLVPSGVTWADLTLAGVSILNIEHLVELDPYRFGASDCDANGDLVVSDD